MTVEATPSRTGTLFLRVPAMFQVGLIFGLAIAAFDISALILFDKPNAMGTLLPVALHLAGSMVSTWALYAGLWLLVGLPVVLFSRPSALPVSIAVAGALAPLLVLRAISIPVTTISLAGNPYRSAMWLALSLLVGALTFVGARSLQAHSRRPELYQASALALPMLLFELLAVAWVRMYRMPGGLHPTAILMYGAALLVMAATVAAMWFPAVRRRVPLLLGITAAGLLVVLGGFRSWTAPDIREHASTFSKPHAIPRVILITVDTLRRDFLNVYSPETDIGTEIGALARDSIIFEDAYTSSPWTLPSMASIMTGLSPQVHNVNRKAPSFPMLPPTIGDVLLEDGYVTAAFGANGLLSRQGSLERGFQEYDFPLGTPGSSLGKQFLTMIVGRETMLGQGLTEYITDLGERWVEANRNRDFFLWLHYMDPHDPYLPPREFVADPRKAPSNRIGLTFDRRAIRNGETAFTERQKEWTRELYRSEVRYVDDRIGRLIRTLKSLDLYDDSLIIFTTDHGEEFWEHENVDHGHTLYNELIATPLFVKLPAAMTPERTRVRALAGNVSVMPTILDLCGISYEEAQFSANSLVPLWASKEEPAESRAAFSSKLVYYDERVSVVHEGWKYIRFADRPTEELYNLNEDPGEKTNVVNLSHARREELRALLESHREKSRELAKLYRIGQAVSAAEQEAIRRDLRSLGYIQ
jgi:arylsulfatase A-like enzyme